MSLSAYLFFVYRIGIAGSIDTYFSQVGGMIKEIKEIKEIIRFRYVIYFSVINGLKQRYRRSVLGYLWTVLVPLVNYATLAVVFLYGLRMAPGKNNFFVHMFSGSIIFGVCTAVISQSCLIMVNNESYIKKIYVPKMVFVLNVVFTEMVNFLFVLVALMLLGLVTKQIHLSVQYLLIFPTILLIVPFLTGIAAVCSVACVYFNDLRHMIPVVMNMLYFISPILYSFDMAPPFLIKINSINPFFYFLELFRFPLASSTLSLMTISAVCVSLSAFSFLFGFYILRKFNNKILFKL
jgi:ABC-type polysaccharide/polyol phosphate export permease